MKYYAVKNGRKNGVYTSWSECEKQVKGFKGAVYKSFSSKDDAYNYINDKVNDNNNCELVAYVDGSFNIKAKIYGYGVVILKDNKVIEEIYGKGDHEEYVSMRNVAGEIFGSEVAIEYAIKNNYKSIMIHYDYMGIEKWANNEWKANKAGTIRYQNLIKEYREKIDIVFKKVKAHSGDLYNDKADMLAKKAVGINE